MAYPNLKEVIRAEEERKKRRGATPPLEAAQRDASYKSADDSLRKFTEGRYMNFFLNNQRKGGTRPNIQTGPTIQPSPEEPLFAPPVVQNPTAANPARPVPYSPIQPNGDIEGPASGFAESMQAKLRYPEGAALNDNTSNLPSYAEHVNKESGGGGIKNAARHAGGTVMDIGRLVKEGAINLWDRDAGKRYSDRLLEEAVEKTGSSQPSLLQEQSRPTSPSGSPIAAALDSNKSFAEQKADYAERQKSRTRSGQIAYDNVGGVVNTDKAGDVPTQVATQKKAAASMREAVGMPNGARDITRNARVAKQVQDIDDRIEKAEVLLRHAGRRSDRDTGHLATEILERAQKKVDDLYAKKNDLVGPKKKKPLNEHEIKQQGVRMTAFANAMSAAISDGRTPEEIGELVSVANLGGLLSEEGRESSQALIYYLTNPDDVPEPTNQLLSKVWGPQWRENGAEHLDPNDKPDGDNVGWMSRVLGRAFGKGKEA